MPILLMVRRVRRMTVLYSSPCCGTVQNDMPGVYSFHLALNGLTNFGKVRWRVQPDRGGGSRLILPALANGACTMRPMRFTRASANGPLTDILHAFIVSRSRTGEFR